MKLARIIASTVTLAAVICGVTLAEELPRKKFIQSGWDQVTPERLRDMLEHVEQQPFHGQVVRFTGRDGAPYFSYAFRQADWDIEAVEQVIEDLQAVQAATTRPRERFLLILANPGDVDWFDDEGWASIVEHWRIAARVAREGGLKGILFDPEPYNNPHRQFAWTAQPQYEQHSFLEYHQKARQRGAEVMNAIAGEYPDITLFCYFLNSINRMAASRPDPIGSLPGGTYDLLPGFIDGWLDVIPPEMTLIDGCESAYRYNSREEYLDAYNRIKGDCQRLVSPENRAKYRAQVQVSFGMYLDAYINPPDSPWYIDPQGMERVERLGQNLRHALEVADEYVWVYGEKASWWPNPNPRSEQRWWDALPGIVEQLHAVADPTGYALMKLEQAGDALDNLVVNGDFAAPQAPPQEEGAPDWEVEGAPPGWSFWRHPNSEGSFAWDRAEGRETPGSARLSGLANGCFLQKVPVGPGESYAVIAWRKIAGEGRAAMRVRWQDPDGRWHMPHLDVMLDASGAREEWAQMAGTVIVPEGAGFMVPLLSANGQLGEDDAIWYDDVVVFRLN